MSPSEIFDLVRLEQHPWLAGLEHFALAESTNDLALERAAWERLPCPHLIVADRQSRGRGRGTNTWWSDAGALTFTVLVDAEQAGVGAEDWPLLSLTTGLAVIEALESFADRPLRVKWPNDIYLDGRKLGGILVEAGRGKVGRFAIGIGLNINNSLTSAPPDVQRRATSLVDSTQRAVDLTDVLWVLLTSLGENLERLAADSAVVYRRWPHVCQLTGERVAVTIGDRQILGTCRGISPRGALLVETPEGVEACFAGTVTWHGREG